MPEFHANGLSPRAYAGLWVLYRHATGSYDKARRIDVAFRIKNYVRSIMREA